MNLFVWKNESVNFTEDISQENVFLKLKFQAKAYILNVWKSQFSAIGSIFSNGPEINNTDGLAKSVKVVKEISPETCLKI